MRKQIIYVGLLLLLCSVTGCNAEKPDETKPTEKVTETERPKKENTKEKQASHKQKVVKNTDCGYELKYNPDIFQYYYAEGVDNYTPVDEAVEKEGTVYVTVQLFQNADATEVAKSFQSGSDEEIKEKKIGAENILAKYIYSETKADHTTQYVKRYVLQRKKDVLLVETSGYKDMDEQVLQEIESMLGSFRME